MSARHRLPGPPGERIATCRAADESTAEAIADWRYWLAQGYCFVPQRRRSAVEQEEPHI